MTTWPILVLATILWLAVGSSPPAAADLATLLKPYLEALEGGQTGEVAGRVYEEPQRPGAPAVAIGSVPLLLLPAVAGIESDLETVRASFRVSGPAYAQAADRLLEIRAVREQRVKAAGAEQLVRSGFTAPDGSFRFTDVPAGAWTLVAWQSSGPPPGERRSPSARRRQATAPFSDNPDRRMTGVVTYWWSRIEVIPGGSAAVDLTDRNWKVTVVREERKERPVSPPTPKDAAR